MSPWVEVANDAVKIGLGAIIGAAASLLSARQTHSHRRQESYSNRRRDSLERIMMDFDSLSRASMSDVAHMLEGLFERKEKPGPIDPARYDHSVRWESVSERNLKFNAVESSVALLGFRALATEIEKFRALALEISKIKVTTFGEHGSKAGALDDLRNSVIDQFAVVYENA